MQQEVLTVAILESIMSLYVCNLDSKQYMCTKCYPYNDI